MILACCQCWVCRIVSFLAHGELWNQELQRPFEGRPGRLNSEEEVALTDEFANDPSKQTQWQVFLRKSDLEFIEFGEVITQLRKCIVALLGDDLRS